MGTFLSIIYECLGEVTKRAIRIISGVHPRTHTDPLFTELKLLKCDEINKYLIGRLMYRIYNEDITFFDSMFMINEQVHNYDTRQRDHYHVHMYLAWSQDLAKSICDTMVLLFGTVYCLVESLLMSVKQFFPNNWNGTLKNHTPGI